MIKTKVLLALAALIPITAFASLTASAQTAPARCTVSASTPWTNAAGRYRMEAVADGPNCSRAVATFVMRSPSGEVLHHASYQTDQVMVLAGANTKAAMQTALREWVAGSNAPSQTTARLPNWAVGADAPSAGEFPFYPAEGVTREQYLAVKAKRLPYFCYVQGMESLACFVAEKGGLEQLGVQTFPG